MNRLYSTNPNIDILPLRSPDLSLPTTLHGRQISVLQPHNLRGTEGKFGLQIHSFPQPLIRVGTLLLNGFTRIPQILSRLTYWLAEHVLLGWKMSINRLPCYPNFC